MEQRGAVGGWHRMGAIAEPRLAMVACCCPLHSLPGAERLRAGMVSGGHRHADAAGRRACEERALRASIPVLTAVDDEIARPAAMRKIRIRAGRRRARRERR